MTHPVEENLRLASAPAQFDNIQPAIHRPAPRLGEHTAQILAELGYSPADIEKLTASRTILHS